MDDACCVILRPYSAETDQPCIYATWRNGSYYGALRRYKGPSERYFREYTAYIKEILSDADCHVRVACLSDDPSMIVGYSVSTKLHLDWIFVKADYRNKGIGTLLYPRDTETVTDHLTKIGNQIVIKKKLKVKGESINGTRAEVR